VSRVQYVLHCVSIRNPNVGPAFAVHVENRLSQPVLWDKRPVVPYPVPVAFPRFVLLSVPIPFGGMGRLTTGPRTPYLLTPSFSGVQYPITVSGNEKGEARSRHDRDQSSTAEEARARSSRRKYWQRSFSSWASIRSASPCSAERGAVRRLRAS